PPPRPSTLSLHDALPISISAVDVALWDLKAKEARQPLYKLLGPYRDAMPIYGSGGFTTYSERELAEQLAGWVGAGIPRVKMKIGDRKSTRLNSSHGSISY